ncbi:MAG: DUF2807 domain-containing protein [Bacteroides sp.]
MNRKTNRWAVAWVLVLCTVFIPVQAQSKKNCVVREVPVKAFSAIRLEAIGTIVFKQLDDCSLRIEGLAKKVDRYRIEVKDRTLVIRFKKPDEKVANNGCKNDEVTFYLSAPDLKLIDFNGMGSICCPNRLELPDLELAVKGISNIHLADLNCRKLQATFEGMGDVDIHLNCKALVTKVSGMVNAAFSGKAGKAIIQKDGLVVVNTNHLIIGDHED